jgi:hypothetical protein
VKTEMKRWRYKSVIEKAVEEDVGETKGWLLKTQKHRAKEKGGM